MTSMMHTPEKRAARKSAQQRGFTLIECMVALALGLLVMLAATALLLSAQKTYLVIDDNARIADTAAFALAALGSAIRQAAYADRGKGVAPPSSPGNALEGIDNAALSGLALPDSRHRSAVNGSDVLMTRFMANDAYGAIDDDMRNCAGHLNKYSAKNSAERRTDKRTKKQTETTEEALPQHGAIDADAAYNWSMFYIQYDDSNVPELFCRYRSATKKFHSDAIARDVEAMQLLYGVDTDDDGLPNTFLNANAIGNADWRKVVAVRIALVVSGAAASTAVTAAKIYPVLHFFGEAYSGQHGAADPGVRLDPANLKPARRHRLRRLFHSTVILRNPVGERAGSTDMPGSP